MPDVFVLSLLTAIFTMASTSIAGDSITNADILDYRRQHGSALTAKWLKDTVYHDCNSQSCEIYVNRCF